MNIEKYRDQIKIAVQKFWETRDKQMLDQNGKEIQDAGNRSAVTGGTYSGQYWFFVTFGDTLTGFREYHLPFKQFKASTPIHSSLFVF